MGRMKYLQRRANRFEFRYPLPDDVAGNPVPEPWPEVLAALLNRKTGRLKTEIIRSLQTSDPKIAECRALPHIEESHRLVDEARRVLREGPAVGFRLMIWPASSVNTQPSSWSVMRS